jgi:hypothetical protein
MLLGPFKITVFRLAQLANVQKSIFFIPAGISTAVISVLLKALAPSFINAEGNMTEVSPVIAKAPLPISVTPSGM